MHAGIFQERYLAGLRENANAVNELAGHAGLGEAIFLYLSRERQSDGAVAPKDDLKSTSWLADSPPDAANG